MSAPVPGGALGGVEDLYREVILEHFRAPRNKGDLRPSDAEAEGVNPLCGDQIRIMLRIRDGRVTDVRFDGHGCAISQAAASMMTELVCGLTEKDVAHVAAHFKAMLGVTINDAPPPPPPPDMGDLEALEGVKRFPVRIKCALLGWNTLLQALEDHHDGTR